MTIQIVWSTLQHDQIVLLRNGAWVDLCHLLQHNLQYYIHYTCMYNLTSKKVHSYGWYTYQNLQYCPME